MPISPQITITPEDITTKNFDITVVTFTSSTATYTAVGHTFSVGDEVLVSGLVPDGYNGTFVLTAIATNTFTVANTTNATVTDQSGTAFWADNTEYSYEDLDAAYLTDINDLNDATTVLAGAIALAQAEADFAAAEAAFAQTAAGNAQTTADGKNKIFRQGTTPSGTFTVNDLWYDTSTGNKPYIWTGSAWTSVQDASIATALAAGNAAQTTANGKNKITYSASAPGATANTAGDLWWQFASGVVTGQWTGAGGTTWTSNTIGNAVLANIDAAKITAGTISAAISMSAATITGGSINIGSGVFVVTTLGAVTITAGSLNINTGTFIVTTAGALTATNATITGSITASTGAIGGWIITSTQMYSGTGAFMNSNTGNIGGNNVTAFSQFSGGGMLVSGGVLDMTGRIQASGRIEASGVLQANGNLTVAGTSTFTGSTTFNGVDNAFPNISSTASAANVRWGTTGGGRLFWVTSSSARFKENIIDIRAIDELDPKKLLQLPVRAFSYKSDHLSETDERSEIMVPGFIAEEVDEIYTIAADYELGQPNNWNDKFIIPGMLALIQDQEARIKQLEGK